MYKPFFILILLIFPRFADAQDDENTVQIQEIIDSYVQNQTDDVVSNDLVEYLQNRVANPIDLNHTSSDELSQLQFLTDFQIKSIIDFVQHHAPLRSKYELQFALGLDAQTLRWLYWFTTVQIVDNNITLPPFDKIRGDVLLKGSRLLTLSKGYSDSIRKYEGDPSRVYSAVRCRAGRNWQCGITAEKDAGETFKSGADFYSGYLQWDGKALLKRVVIGDFRAHYGQGICVGSSFASGLSSLSPSLFRKNDRGVFHYVPYDENYFWRGAAANFQYKQWVITGWGSYHFIDASLNELDSAAYITSIQSTGLHRTATEIANRHQLGYGCFGTNLSYSTERVKIGATIITHHFAIPQRKGEKPYQVNNFEGRNLLNASLYYYYPSKYLDFWGEAASDDSLNGAMLHGISLAGASTLQLSIVRRDYSVAYHSFMSSAFSQNSKPQNEHGTTLVSEIIPCSTFKIKAVYDFFTSPWLRYQTSAPSFGTEGILSASWNPSNTSFSSTLVYKRRISERNNNETIAYPELIKNQQVRLQINYSILSLIRMGNRIEICHNSMNNSTMGILAWQDVACKFRTISCAGRFAFFDTKWENRIYAVEDDMKRSFYSSLYYGFGFRWYVVLGWQNVANTLLLQVKYSDSTYPNNATIGSGNDMIVGQSKKEIKALISYSF